MGVLLQAFYQRGDKGVPTPFEGDNIDPWWDHLAKQAQSFQRVGFTAVWLPPVTKGASGGFSIGYDVFDDYDLGSKNQKGTIATRYGTREQLARCVAVMRANGLDVYLDLVENQRSGGSGPGGFTFRYVDADGNPVGGRFPKNPENFHPNVPEDPGTVPGQDFSFGSDLAPINGKPPGYVFNGLIDSADWLTRALDVQGYRLDDAKGVSTRFMLPLLNSGSIKGKFAVGEFFDGNLALIQNWLFNGMQGRASAFDFPTRFMLQRMCNRSGPFSMASLDHAGLAGSNPFNAVTFVENHDTDSQPFEAIISNKALGYAYILTSEGYPCVFYKDYSADPGCYGGGKVDNTHTLKGVIENLIFIHEKIASGDTVQRFEDFDVFAYERRGGPHLLTALNNDQQNSRTITVDTEFGPNRILHDYSGHHSNDVRTDGNGRVTIAIPKGQNGFGYVCYSVLGIGGDFTIDGHSVTQALEGAHDLDIKPADNMQFVQVGRAWCEKGKEILVSLRFDTKDWTDTTTITLQLLDSNNQPLVPDKIYHKSTAQGDQVVAHATVTGWHTFRLRSDSTPPTNVRPAYTLDITYSAPRTLTVA
jgi:alpha-amylase